MTITDPQVETAKPNVAIILLAAGASTRMGVPKQLLPYQGRSLLNRTIESAIASVCKPVVVVLGANCQHIRSQVNQTGVEVIENPEWKLGMSTSIKSGILSLSKCSESIDAAIIAVCDQPFVSAEIINNLVATYCSTGKPIIASRYAETLGVPALFSHKFFSELAALRETIGAKYLIEKHLSEVFCVPFPLGVIDIDTPQDYEQLQMRDSIAPLEK
ncbi:nucleotidyltransferase family protein [Chlorogloeopsis sp. ULAP01]|uniref:nucleotidyltransferase family protein n=1 Tax=Chlorogloeopsis sp. ULAP01 TaxID=3056483 RepID=UPI0025AB1614|nr:nucleotidyltransferase family protein [Chlorogloeopsis sp. ULAP01]MDM9382042.1 nucleotidyltransferase family protein [Chlorogloeopsis sp. ULAP01]